MQLAINQLSALVALWDGSRAESADMRLDTMFDGIEAARQLLSDLSAPAFQKGMKDAAAGVEFGRSMDKPDDMYRRGFAAQRGDVHPPAPRATDAVVKIVDDMRNVSYIRHNGRRGWSCTLANGIPASMFYAGVASGEETETVVALDRAKTPADVLRIVQNRINRRCTAELV